MVNKNRVGESEQAPQPEQEHTITDTETVKVMADALRNQMINILRGEPRTVKELASLLDTSPKKLYYHVNLLLEHGLIRVVGTRLVSGIVEKRYQTTAYIFNFDRALFHPSHPATGDNLNVMLGAMLSWTESDIEDSLRAGLIDQADDAAPEHQLFLQWNLNRLSAEQLRLFRERLEEVLRELPPFEGEEGSQGEQAYRLLIAHYPTARRYSPPAENQERDRV